MTIGLIIILILVLILPFSVKSIEHNLEIFLFIMGIIAAFISGALDQSLLLKAIEDPVNISLAVLIAGVLFKWLQEPLEVGILRISDMIGYRLFLMVVVIFLGLIASVITAIIAALVLTLVVSVLRLDRQSEIKLVILACFSIGLGAALTPIGEPLSTIAISKLGEDFFFLLRLIGTDVIPTVVIFGLLTAILVKPSISNNGLTEQQSSEPYREIFIRALKIYLFVMGLTFLGEGFEPLINKYLLGLSPLLLYWINMISAVLDNATLAAAEISPAMDDRTIKAILLGLLISGGMLIPGNIPNIIAAGKLNITSKEWARFGVPVGLLTMIIFFLVILFIH